MKHTNTHTHLCSDFPTAPIQVFSIGSNEPAERSCLRRCRSACWAGKLAADGDHQGGVTFVLTIDLKSIEQFKLFGSNASTGNLSEFVAAAVKAGVL